MAQERTLTQWERDNPWEATLARNIGRGITDARRGRMSQEDLAKAVGVSRNSIANYEIGRGIPRLGTLIQIAAVLNTSPVALMYPDPSDDIANLVEVLPGVEATGFDAAQWFSGLRHGFTDKAGTACDGAESARLRMEWRKNTRELRLWRELRELEDQQSKTSKVRAGGQLTDTQRELMERYQHDIDEKRRELGIAGDA